jgi:hypothetical protein
MTIVTAFRHTAINTMLCTSEKERTHEKHLPTETSKGVDLRLHKYLVHSKKIPLNANIEPTRFFDFFYRYTINAFITVAQCSDNF